MPHLKALVFFGVLSLVAGVDSRATDLIKADNTTSLNTAGSYTDPLATPTNADWVIFNNAFATTTGSVLTGATTARGLRLVNPGNNVTMSVSNSTFSLGVNGSTSSATSGSIDMSSATKDLTINSGASGNLRFYGSLPSINVTSGRTLNISAQVVAYNGGSLKTEGAGAINLNGVVKDNDATHFTGIAHAGPGTLTLAGANTYTGGTSVSSGTVAISQTFSMGATSVNAIGINAGAGTHGKISFTGTTLTYGGSLQLDLTGTFASSGTFDLLDFGLGASSGSFTSVSIAGSYVASLTNNGSGVWSGAADGTTFVFNQASGDLTVSAIPEPSTMAAFAGMAGLVAALVLRRRRN